MKSEEITSRQTDFYQLNSEVAKLSPRLKPLEVSDEQKALRSRMALLQARQSELIAWFADLLDEELWPDQAALEREYIDELAALQETPHAELDAACEHIAFVNGRRIAAYQELKRCARIAGRPRPPFPIHAGIPANEICESEKIKLAFLGFGAPTGRGRGQVTSYGGGA